MVVNEKLVKSSLKSKLTNLPGLKLDLEEEKVTACTSPGCDKISIEQVDSGESNGNSTAATISIADNTSSRQSSIASENSTCCSV